MSPLEDVEADLKETQAQIRSFPGHKVDRIYLVGANPFVLNFERLRDIANLIHKYFPECQSIGCFARVTDVTLKTDEQLAALHELGYDSLTIGVETGHDKALEFMHKGYKSEEIITQCHRLDASQIHYNFFYLSGISGAGSGQIGALESAKVFNQTHPLIIGSSMLTIYPESKLYEEIQAGNWAEEGELEKLQELKALIDNLNIPVFFASLGASNAIYVQGQLPKDKEKMVSYLEEMCKIQSEAELRYYRTHLPHL
jgi:radical SAM superfamily enzyme YgiQ (UPF0313 family)